RVLGVHDHTYTGTPHDSLRPPKRVPSARPSCPAPLRVDFTWTSRRARLPFRAPGLPGGRPARRLPRRPAPGRLGPPMVDGLSYLSERLAVVESRVQAAVARRPATDPTPDDHLRGLYITEADL